MYAPTRKENQASIPQNWHEQQNIEGDEPAEHTPETLSGFAAILSTGISTMMLGVVLFIRLTLPPVRQCPTLFAGTENSRS